MEGEGELKAESTHTHDQFVTSPESHGVGIEGIDV
jgi:hypothetical protein